VSDNVEMRRIRSCNVR